MMLPTSVYSPDLEWFFCRADSALGNRSDAADRLDNIEVFGRAGVQAHKDPGERRGAKLGSEYGSGRRTFYEAIDGDDGMFGLMRRPFTAMPRGSSVKTGTGIVGATERVDDRRGTTAAGKRCDETHELTAPSLFDEVLRRMPPQKQRAAGRRADRILRALRGMHWRDSGLLSRWYAHDVNQRETALRFYIELRLQIAAAHRAYRRHIEHENTLIEIALRHTRHGAESGAT